MLARATIDLSLRTVSRWRLFYNACTLTRGDLHTSLAIADASRQNPIVEVGLGSLSQIFADQRQLIDRSKGYAVNLAAAGITKIEVTGVMSAIEVKDLLDTLTDRSLLAAGEQVPLHLMDIERAANDSTLIEERIVVINLLRDIFRQGQRSLQNKFLENLSPSNRQDLVKILITAPDDLFAEIYMGWEKVNERVFLGDYLSYQNCLGQSEKTELLINGLVAPIQQKPLSTKLLRETNITTEQSALLIQKFFAAEPELAGCSLSFQPLKRRSEILSALNKLDATLAIAVRPYVPLPSGVTIDPVLDKPVYNLDNARDLQLLPLVVASIISRALKKSGLRPEERTVIVGYVTSAESIGGGEYGAYELIEVPVFGTAIDYWADYAETDFQEAAAIINLHPLVKRPSILQELHKINPTLCGKIKPYVLLA